jgi:hypothetical protein
MCSLPVSYDHRYAQPAALVAGQLSKRGYATIFMAPASVQYLIKDHPEIRFVDFGISMQDARERTEEGERLNHLHFHDHRRKVVGESVFDPS